VIGVSVDTRPAQNKFAEELGVDFPLLSDFPRNEVSRAYGVYDEERGVARRTTFLIDKQGVIRRIDAGSDAMDPSGVKESCRLLR
jgi:mycoredoxin-dependent peroxiredoxin